MAFHPLQEKGIPFERQVRNWDELNREPYDKNGVHPYTRTRIILMNGIEVEAALFGHQMARQADAYDLKQKLAQVRRIEQQQQKTIHWLIPADESTREATLGYEQVAVDLTAWLAQTEPEENVRNALNFALIEDFDHLHLAAELLDQDEGRDAESLLPSELPELIRFQSNKQYIRSILAAQIDLTADGNMYTPVEALSDSARYFTWQRLVNVDGSAPSQRVIEERIDRHGTDYRLETEGPHPIAELRARARVPAGSLSPAAPQAVRT
jgi:hypothetical protein